MPTGIDWCDEVWNPVIGCSKVSAGCDNCYAERMANRLRRNEYTTQYGLVHNGTGWTGWTTLNRRALERPFRWKKPRAVFVNSMGDLFHNSVEGRWLAEVMSVMGKCPQHTFIVLTKRAAAMRAYMGLRESLPNVWLGVSVENQETYDARVPELLATPAAKHLISYEPALGPIKLNVVPKVFRSAWIDWVIAGAETGPGARPAELGWFRYWRDECMRAGKPFWLKQTDGQHHDLLDGVQHKGRPRWAHEEGL